jgi:hypothetical protein
MKKILFGLATSVLIISTSLILPEDVFAGGSFYLSPSSRSVPQGTTFSVAVRVSSTDPINSVSAYLSYPADKFDFVSISTSGSAFSMEVENFGGGGQVKLSRGLPGTVTGDKLIATVTFRGKLNSGSASINFASGTLATNANGDSVVTATSGGTYTFAPPPPPPPPPDTTAPKISDVKVTATSFKGATIEWKTDEPSTSVVEYGVNNKYGLSAESPGLTKDHKVTFSSELLVLGESYHFRVKSADAAGNLVVGKDATFKARGIPVKIKVVDSKGRGIKKAKVTLASAPMTATTDKDGIATFADVAPGKHLVSTDAGGRIQAFQIDVKEPTDKEIAVGLANPQSFQIQLITTPNQLTRYLVAAVAGLLVILVGLSFLLWYRFKKRPI